MRGENVKLHQNDDESTTNAPHKRDLDKRCLFCIFLYSELIFIYVQHLPSLCIPLKTAKLINRVSNVFRTAICSSPLQKFCLKSVQLSKQTGKVINQCDLD